MSVPVIKIAELSKKFIISHEVQERYRSLGEIVTKKGSQLFKGKIKNSPVSSEEFYALKNINLEIHPGDRVGIIGRNGAGKSTLLKVLSRITEPTGGRISIRGRVASLLEVGTGFHPELTGRENVFLNGAILGMARSEIRRKFDEIVSFAEVEKFLDTPVKRYSSGMYVRLAFAVAAHLEPEILVVDEVLAVGDAQFQKKCLGKMEDVSRNEGRTILFVSHNMGIVAQLCNRAVLLHQGMVKENGYVQEVVNEYINSGQAFDGIEYVADEKKIKNKVNYFNRIRLLNSKDQPASEFMFDESVRIGFEFTINEFISHLQVGIGIQDKYQNRVTTFLKPIDFFKSGEDRYAGKVELPPNVFAPNSYSLVFALWTKGSSTYDSVENICHFKIHDNGSEMASYEGVDYGSIIINPKWSNNA